MPFDKWVGQRWRQDECAGRGEDDRRRGRLGRSSDGQAGVRGSDPPFATDAAATREREDRGAGARLFRLFCEGRIGLVPYGLPGRPIPGAACWHCGSTPLSYMLHPPPLTCVGHLFEFRWSACRGGVWPTRTRIAVFTMSRARQRRLRSFRGRKDEQHGQPTRRHICSGTPQAKCGPDPAGCCQRVCPAVGPRRLADLCATCGDRFRNRPAGSSPFGPQHGSVSASLARPHRHEDHPRSGHAVARLSASPANAATTPRALLSTTLPAASA